MRIAVMVAVVGCAAIAAQPAEALTTITKSVPLTGMQGSIAGVTATCPPGTNVVSGGFEARDTLGDPSSALVFQSKRKGTRSWTTSAIEATSLNVPGTLTVSAYCDPKAPLATQVSKDAHLGISEVKTATAQCPKGKKATAGGFFVQVTPDFLQAGQIVSSFRAGKRAWAATGAEVGGEGDTHVTALAYCTGGVGKTKEETGTGATFSAGSPASDRSGKCPRSPGVRSGGFKTVPGVHPQYTIFQSKRQGRTWVAGGRQIDSGSTITALAYCP